MEQNEVVAQWHGLDEPCRDREWGWKGSVQHTGLCAPACLQSHHKAQKLWAQRDAQTLPQRKLLERNVFMSSFCTQEQFRTHQKPLTPKRCWKLSHGSVTFSLLIHAWKKNRYSTEYLPFPRYCLVWLYCMINYYNQKKKKRKKGCEEAGLYQYFPHQLGFTKLCLSFALPCASMRASSCQQTFQFCFKNGLQSSLYL